VSTEGWLPEEAGEEKEAQRAPGSLLTPASTVAAPEAARRVTSPTEGARGAFPAASPTYVTPPPRVLIQPPATAQKNPALNLLSPGCELRVHVPALAGLHVQAAHFGSELQLARQSEALGEGVLEIMVVASPVRSQSFMEPQGMVRYRETFTGCVDKEFVTRRENTVAG